MERKLYRSRDDRMIWGVCGGIAQYFGIDPTIIRVLAILLTLVSHGAGFIAYIIMAIVVPLESSPAREPKDVIKENVAEIKQTASQLGDEMRSTFARQGEEVKEMNKTGLRGHHVLGIILVVIGIVFLFTSFNLFWWLKWNYLWPLLIIAIGLVIIFGARRR